MARAFLPASQRTRWPPKQTLFYLQNSAFHRAPCYPAGNAHKVRPKTPFGDALVEKNRTWILKSYPSSMPGPESFDLIDRPAVAPRAGELLVRTLWLSVDPYMRARLSAAKNYTAGQKIGEMMEGGGVGEVIASEDPGFRPGEIVMADDFGWQPQP